MLLIHLKRFSFKGPFTDKLETVVDFPLRGLDLTNYMPPPMPPGSDKRQSVPLSPDDPRAQIPPYKYDLYGVTNHFGKLSSGHCKYSMTPHVDLTIEYRLQTQPSLILEEVGFTVTIVE